MYALCLTCDLVSRLDLDMHTRHLLPRPGLVGEARRERTGVSGMRTGVAPSDPNEFYWCLSCRSRYKRVGRDPGRRQRLRRRSFLLALEHRGLAEGANPEARSKHGDRRIDRPTESTRPTGTCACLVSSIVDAGSGSRSAPFPPEFFAIIERNAPFYASLSESERGELEGHVRVFLAEKNFEGCNGLELTDEIKVTVVVHAVACCTGDPMSSLA